MIDRLFRWLFGELEEGHVHPLIIEHNQISDMTPSATLFAPREDRAVPASGEPRGQLSRAVARIAEAVDNVFADEASERS